MNNIRKYRPGEAGSSKLSEERDEFERDYARLIQSPTFRRLQGSRRYSAQDQVIIIEHV